MWNLYLNVQCKIVIRHGNIAFLGMHFILILSNFQKVDTIAWLDVVACLSIRSFRHELLKLNCQSWLKLPGIHFLIVTDSSFLVDIKTRFQEFSPSTLWLRSRRLSNVPFSHNRTNIRSFCLIKLWNFHFPFDANLGSHVLIRVRSVMSRGKGRDEARCEWGHIIYIIFSSSSH